jgi:hypothetical protein
MQFGSGRWTSDELPFSLDDWWRDQLGRIVVDRLEKYSNFVLTSKALVPGEDERLLLNRVEWLRWGIALSAGIPTFDLARAIFGQLEESVPRIHVSVVPHLFGSYGLERSKAEPDDFTRAARFAERVERMYRRKREHPLLYWRILSGFTAFRLAAQTPHGKVNSISSCAPSSHTHRRVFSAKRSLPNMGRPSSIKVTIQRQKFWLTCIGFAIKPSITNTSRKRDYRAAFPRKR